MSDWSVKIKRYRELCNSPEAHLVSAKRNEFLALFEELKALDTTGVLLDEIQALQKENAELRDCVIDLERQVDCICTDDRTCSMCEARCKHKATIDRLLGGEK